MHLRRTANGPRLAQFLRDNVERFHRGEVAIWTHHLGGIPGSVKAERAAGWAQSSDHRFEVSLSHIGPHNMISIRPLEDN